MVGRAGSSDLNACANSFAATSNDPWGPVGSDMAEIAQMTYE
jgi:ENTH domain